MVPAAVAPGAPVMGRHSSGMFGADRLREAAALYQGSRETFCPISHENKELQAFKLSQRV